MITTNYNSTALTPYFSLSLTPVPAYNNATTFSYYLPSSPMIGYPSANYTAATAVVPYVDAKSLAVTSSFGQCEYDPALLELDPTGIYSAMKADNLEFYKYALENSGITVEWCKTQAADIYERLESNGFIEMHSDSSIKVYLPAILPVSRTPAWWQRVFNEVSKFLPGECETFTGSSSLSPKEQVLQAIDQTYVKRRVAAKFIEYCKEQPGIMNSEKPQNERQFAALLMSYSESQWKKVLSEPENRDFLEGYNLLNLVAENLPEARRIHFFRSIDQKLLQKKVEDGIDVGWIVSTLSAKDWPEFFRLLGSEHLMQMDKSFNGYIFKYVKPDNWEKLVDALGKDYFEQTIRNSADEKAFLEPLQHKATKSDQDTKYPFLKTKHIFFPDRRFNEQEDDSTKKSSLVISGPR